MPGDHGRTGLVWRGQVSAPWRRKGRFERLLTPPFHELLPCPASLSCMPFCFSPSSGLLSPGRHRIHPRAPSFHSPHSSPLLLPPPADASLWTRRGTSFLPHHSSGSRLTWLHLASAPRPGHQPWVYCRAVSVLVQVLRARPVFTVSVPGLA